METNQTKKTNKGISINVIAIPLLIIIALMHVFIVLFMLHINRTSDNIFNLIEKSSAYQTDATNIQVNNTTLSETCNNYLQMPVVENNQSNIGPLMAYTTTLSNNNRSTKVAERFKKYNVSEEVLGCIITASELSEQIINVQIHAISVMASVYPLPPIQSLTQVFCTELTQEELAMSNEQRVTYARNLVQESDYAQLRYNIAQNIETCNNKLQQDSSQSSETARDYIALMRAWLWVLVSFVILALCTTFALFYHHFIRPIRRLAKVINSNKCIDRSSKIREMEQLIGSYNELIKYRNRTEAVLRKKAENDALTGLPNRYCLERDLLKEEDNEGPYALLMFDVNYLKLTNDTKGHLSGDELIKNSAKCIRACFGKSGINNCYRIGGDEFTVLLPNCSEREVRVRIERFKQNLIKQKISVAVGYAYTDDISDTNFNKLMHIADKNMYEQKRIDHIVNDKTKME